MCRKIKPDVDRCIFVARSVCGHGLSAELRIFKHDFVCSLMCRVF